MRPLLKHTYVNEMQGDSRAQNRSVQKLHEDLSTESTLQVATEGSYE